MAITPIQSAGSSDSLSPFEQAFPGDVTAGNLITCSGSLYTASDTAIVLGDIAKSAGTATFTDAQLLTVSTPFSGGGPTERAHAWIWSAVVTTPGSLTMGLTRADGSSGPITVAEYSADTGWNTSRLEDSASDVSATAGTGTASSGGATSADDALFHGAFSLARSGENSPITAGGGTPNTIAQEGDGILHMCGSVAYGIVSTGTTDDAEWSYVTTGGQGWAALLAVFREVGAPPANDFAAQSWGNPTPGMLKRTHAGY